MARVALLDVNMLVALFFPEHVHHELAHDWFADHHREGWATCPITENGFVRVACQQQSRDGVMRPVDILRHFRRFCAAKDHHAWSDVVSLNDEALFASEFIRGHRQVTDVYLLGLSKTMNGRLATFDRTIPLKAVRGAMADTLHVITPD